MHAHPLGTIRNDVLHHRSASRGPEHRAGPERFGLDERKVGGFVDGTLSSADEAELAQEVAELLPSEWSESPRAAQRLTQVRDHLGGERQVLEWLDEHPGTPRLLARLFVLLGNLDTYSDDAAVVDALRAARAQGPPPEALRSSLPPGTDTETLGDLAAHIEELLADGKTAQATDVALATTDWVRTAVDQTGASSGDLAEVSALMEHLHTDIEAATKTS